MPKKSKKPKPRSFGAALRHWRCNVAKLTQAEVAKKVGVRPNYIGYLESSQRNPSFDLVKRIAKMMDADIGELWDLVTGLQRYGRRASGIDATSFLVVFEATLMLTTNMDQATAKKCLDEAKKQLTVARRQRGLK